MTERKWWQGDPDPAGAFIDRHPILGRTLLIVALTYIIGMMALTAWRLA